MSEFTFIASQFPLPEVDLTGFQRLKVKDMKRMNVPSGWISWDEMDAEADVLYAETDLEFLSKRNCCMIMDTWEGSQI